MMNAQRFLREDEKKAVQEAVAAAETRTSAELVCAVTTESGRYDRAEALIGLICSLLVLSLAHAVYFAVRKESGSWDASSGLSLGWQCFSIVVGFVLGNVSASYLHPIRRLATGKREMDAETLQSARYVFASRGLTRTSGRGGLMIYVSLYERNIIVLSDEGILKALGQEFLDKLRDEAVGELHDGHRLETFTKTLDTATRSLEEALPVKPDDKNELPNELILIHPRP